MASLREQMQRLADSIARTRNERKAFLDKNQKECIRFKRELQDQRQQTKAELAKEAKAITKQLGDFKRRNQKTVERTLRDLRTVRVKEAKTTKTLLRQEVLKNSRDIARMLRQNKNDRMRAARQLDRASATTLQSVRTQVQRIRVETKRMTKSWSRDRSDARQMWLRLQNNQGTRRDSSFVSRALAAPAASITTTAPVPVSEAESQKPNVLPAPPCIMPQGVSPVMQV